MKKLLFVLLIIAMAPCMALAENTYSCTALIGGTSGALDALDITGATTPNADNLADGDAAIVSTISGATVVHYLFIFDADGTTAESSPTVIRPDDYATAGVWRLTVFPSQMIPDISATYQSVLAEGAFVDGDKTKLDGVETGADVTDATSVANAGALMDSGTDNINDTHINWGDGAGQVGYIDIVGRFGSGSCSGYLKNDGTCETPAGTGNVSDNTAEAITGVWEIQDDTPFNFGNDADFGIRYDETTDDQLEIVSNSATDTTVDIQNAGAGDAVLRVNGQDVTTTAGIMRGASGTGVPDILGSYNFFYEGTLTAARSLNIGDFDMEIPAASAINSSGLIIPAGIASGAYDLGTSAEADTLTEGGIGVPNVNDIPGLSSGTPAILFTLNVKDIDDAVDDVKKKFPRGVTITAVYAICTAGTNVIGTLSEVDSDGIDSDAVVIDSAWTITTTQFSDTSFTNAAIDANDWLQWDTTSVSGSVTNFTLVVWGYET